EPGSRRAFQIETLRAERVIERDEGFAARDEHDVDSLRVETRAGLRGELGGGAGRIGLRFFGGSEHREAGLSRGFHLAARGRMTTAGDDQPALTRRWLDSRGGQSEPTREGPREAGGADQER